MLRRYVNPAQFPRLRETNRFCARYRAAKAYKGAKFSAYSANDTARGYNALLALMLAFSAFEYFYKEVLRLDVPGMHKLLWDEHATGMKTFLSAFELLVKSPETNQLFRQIHPHLNPAHQRNIDDMLSCTDTNLIRVFAAIRHAFVHGHLTPNMGAVPPTTVIDLCKFGYGFLMKMMDKEFSRRINWSP